MILLTIAQVLITDYLETYDSGLSVGLGLKVGEVIIEAKYFYGFTDIFGTDSSGNTVDSVALIMGFEMN